MSEGLPSDHVAALLGRHRRAGQLVRVTTAALADTAEGAAARAAALEATGATFDQVDGLLADADARLEEARAAVGRYVRTPAAQVIRRLHDAVIAREGQAAATGLQAVAKALIEQRENESKYAV